MPIEPPKCLRIVSIEEIPEIVETVSEILTLVMQFQEQSNWCWSAQGTSIGLFFETGNWTQCDTATQCLNNGEKCCDNPVPCNVYGRVNKALEYTKSFSGYGDAPYPSDQIIDQINKENPVVMRCAWKGGGAHFIAIAGYSYPGSNPSEVTITLKDSIYGDSTMLLSDFPVDYHGGGSWTHTYLTVAQAPAAPTGLHIVP